MGYCDWNRCFVSGNIGRRRVRASLVTHGAETSVLMQIMQPRAIDADRTWRAASVDLGRWAGRAVARASVTKPVADDDSCAWALWSDLERISFPASEPADN